MKKVDNDGLLRKVTAEAHAQHKYWFEHGLRLEVRPHFVDLRYKGWLLGSVWREDKYQKQLVITAACALLEAKRWEES